MSVETLFVPPGRQRRQKHFAAQNVAHDVVLEVVRVAAVPRKVAQRRFLRKAAQQQRLCESRQKAACAARHVACTNCSAFNSSSRSVSALTMSSSLLAAALGAVSCRPFRSLRRAAASPRAAEALVGRVAPRKTAQGRLFLSCSRAFRWRRSQIPSVRALMSAALARRGPRHASSIRKNVSDFRA